MKKRFFSFALVLIMLLSLSGCVNTSTVTAPTATDAPSANDNTGGIEAMEPVVSEAPNTTPLPENSICEVHFIDVGQADAIVINCDNHYMMIDGGNSEDSSLIYSYLKDQNISYLDYVVCTHANEDHVGGLSGALNFAKVEQVFAPVTAYDSKAFNSFLKYVKQQGLEITIPTTGSVISLGSATLQFFAPDKQYDDVNDTSIVIRMVYGDVSFLFTGDATRVREADILAAGYALESTVLKVGHHGSSSSTSYPFLMAIMPKYAVISVGEGNSYGHPSDDTLSRLRDADVTVYRTDMQGTIICTSDGKSVSFSTTKNATANTNPTLTDGSGQNSALASDAQATDHLTYIGNVNSKKFHLSTCNTLPAEKNRVYFQTREEAIAAGYSPCGNCNP